MERRDEALMFGRPVLHETHNQEFLKLLSAFSSESKEEEKLPQLNATFGSFLPCKQRIGRGSQWNTMTTNIRLGCRCFTRDSNAGLLSEIAARRNDDSTFERRVSV